MTTETLSARLQTLSNTYKQTLQLIQRLQKLPSDPGILSDDSDARVELSAEIHQNLKEQEEELDLLRQEADDTSSAGGGRWVGGGSVLRRESSREQDRERLASQIIRLEEDLKLARAHFRRAQLDAKRSSEAAKRKERERLFDRDGSNEPGPGRRKGHEKLTQDELTINAAADVTAALRRTHQTMQAEVDRSQFAQQTLEESSTALASLHESYSNLDTLLSSSKSLVNSLLRTQKSDTWYLETAFYILIATIAWLVFRRILYGPLWWLVWQPVKFLYWTATMMLASVGIIGGSAAQTSALNQKAAFGPPSSSIMSATGAKPTIDSSQSAPYVVVGAKGGGWNNPPWPSAQAGGEGSLVDKIGKMAEKSQRQHEGTNVDDISDEERKRQEQLPRNPKKRMFEADVEDRKREEARKKDEL